MFGWLSRARARASRVNRSANAGSRADLRREDLQGHQPVQFLLPGLVDGAHAAFAEQFEDFELGKPPGQFLDRGRLEPVRTAQRQPSLSSDGLPRLSLSNPACTRALRTQPGRCVLGKLATAFRAESRSLIAFSSNGKVRLPFSTGLRGTGNTTLCDYPLRASSSRPISSSTSVSSATVRATSSRKSWRYRLRIR